MSRKFEWFQKLQETIAQNPIDIDDLKADIIDKEMLRLSIIAELDAVNLYEQMAGITKDENLRKVFLDVAREEKTHIGEFQTLLNKLDPEHGEELEKGRQEVEEMAGEIE